jgi:hypothetical protein
MAEYIDREALLELINEDCKYKNPTNEYTRGCNEVCDWAIKTIKNIPTADVVPKSEYDLLKKSFKELTQEAKGYLNRIYGIRADVASEIFAEIEKIDEDTVSFQEFYSKIMKLKKKYTEG